MVRNANADRPRRARPWPLLQPYPARRADNARTAQVAAGHPRQFAQAKIISVVSRGEMANRMIQYMAALTLARRIGGAVVTGAELPEWAIPPTANPDPADFEQVLRVERSDSPPPDVTALAGIANRGRSVNIIVDDHMQRHTLFDPPRSYDTVFPPPPPTRTTVANNELLIPIRSGDILAGVPHHPLLPIAYYRWLVARSGLQPVFCGQWDTPLYGDRLHRDMPDARFIDIGTTVEDFQLIRSAKHIALSVSTHSWLAAWLSHAQTIFVPLCGFLSPATPPEVDLLVTTDQRYRFIQFPLFHGLPEPGMMEHHQRIDELWREIPPRQVALLRGHFPTRDAGAPKIPLPPGTNLARTGRAIQSSVSPWSRATTIEADAAIAINGQIWQDKFFHTDKDLFPWWCVDLGAACEVTGVRIFNRDGPEFIQRRASPLVIKGSLDGTTWFNLTETGPHEIIGGRSSAPFTWIAPAPVPMRYAAVSIPRQEFLHLAEVEVYGTRPEGGPSAARAAD